MAGSKKRRRSKKSGKSRKSRKNRRIRKSRKSNKQNELVFPHTLASAMVSLDTYREGRSARRGRKRFKWFMYSIPIYRPFHCLTLFTYLCHDPLL